MAVMLLFVSVVMESKWRVCFGLVQGVYVALGVLPWSRIILLEVCLWVCFTGFVLWGKVCCLWCWERCFVFVFHEYVYYLEDVRT